MVMYSYISIDNVGLATSWFKGFWCTTWGAFMFVIIHGCTCGSNVISNMLSIAILVGLTSGSTCMSKVFISVCCAFGFGLMIQNNGVFKLLRGNI
jgi:hypothetical protein